jgi:hypothetical protein
MAWQAPIVHFLSNQQTITCHYGGGSLGCQFLASMEMQGLKFSPKA